MGRVSPHPAGPFPPPGWAASKQPGWTEFQRPGQAGFQHSVGPSLPAPGWIESVFPGGPNSRSRLGRINPPGPECAESASPRIERYLGWAWAGVFASFVRGIGDRVSLGRATIVALTGSSDRCLIGSQRQVGAARIDRVVVEVLLHRPGYTHVSSPHPAWPASLPRPDHCQAGSSALFRDKQQAANRRTHSAKYQCQLSHSGQANEATYRHPCPAWQQYAL